MLACQGGGKGRDQFECESSSDEGKATRQRCLGAEVGCEKGGSLVRSLTADVHADAASRWSRLPRRLALVGTSSLTSSSWDRGLLTF